MNRSGMLTMACAAALALCGTAAGAPFSVGATPKETQWTSWGYTVDSQTWANWLAVDVAWGTEAAMSGTYNIQEDFLLQVDPATSGTQAGSGGDWYDDPYWNHDDTSGLGEFFDAGATDGYYELVLSLGSADTWSVKYVDDSFEHTILAGTVVQYWNRDGYFYGKLRDDDGAYDGYFNDSHNEGTPDLVDDAFHAGHGDPIPEPGTMALLGAGAVAALIRRRRRV